MGGEEGTLLLPNCSIEFFAFSQRIRPNLTSTLSLLFIGAGEKEQKKIDFSFRVESDTMEKSAAVIHRWIVFVVVLFLWQI